MTGTKKLTDAISGLALLALSRAEGTGAEQYTREDGSQEYEHRSVDKLIDETLDELADVVSYASMLAVKLFEIRERFNKLHREWQLRDPHEQHKGDS